MSVLVLSPHRDDAAFSCGLLLAKLAMAGVRVHIVNVCTISDYAPYASLPNANDLAEEITQLRAEEDLAFVQHLQCEFARGQGVVHLLDLGWKDAPLRYVMAADDVLADNPIPMEEISRLAAAFRSLAPASVVLVPLALGGHVDHRLVRRAAIDAWTKSEMVFYEDLPYACRMSTEEREEQIRRALPWRCDRAQIPPARSGEKRHMALRYRSQIDPAVADEMEDHGAALGWTESLYGPEATLRILITLAGSEEITGDR